MKNIINWNDIGVMVNLYHNEVDIKKNLSYGKYDSISCRSFVLKLGKPCSNLAVAIAALSGLLVSVMPAEAAFNSDCNSGTSNRIIYASA